MSNINMLNAFLTDDERAQVAFRSTNPDFSFDDELFQAASECLTSYFAMRSAALDTLMKTDPASLNDPTDMQTASDFHDFYFNQIDKALAPLTLSEQCDRVYRLNETLSILLADDSEQDGTEDFRRDIATMPGYSGEVTDAALHQLIDELSRRLAMLNTTQMDLRQLTRGICAQSAPFLADELISCSRETILREAMSIYTLAHEGKLSQYSSDITIEECVRCTAVSYDLDAIRKAERNGEIASCIASTLAYLLLLAAMVACFLLAAPFFGALSVLAASPALEALYTILFIVTLLTPYIVCIDEFILHDMDNNGIMARISAKAGKLGRYVAIALPAKVRSWLNRSVAPAGAGAAVLPVVTVQEEKTEEAAHAAANAAEPSFA